MCGEWIVSIGLGKGGGPAEAAELESADPTPVPLHQPLGRAISSTPRGRKSFRHRPPLLARIVSATQHFQHRGRHRLLANRLQR